MLTERIDRAEQGLLTDGALQAQSERPSSNPEFEQMLKPHENAIRGLAFGSVLALGIWIALGALIWALTK
jgi:hypothetical protein